MPAHFAADDADALIAKLSRAAAGILVSVDAQGQPIASHLPVLWDGEKRIVTGHIARANHHWQLGDGRALIVLSGPEAYVSPSLYPSKAEHGKVVPTWNYEAVHCSGAIEWFEDATRLRGVVQALSTLHESGRAEPWRIEDAPRPYIDALLGAIIGVEMRVERIEAKRKLSQNKSASDFAGVVRGLAASGGESREVGDLMRELRTISDDPNGN